MRWDHTAAVLCTLANLHRDPKKRRAPYRVEEFHPYHARRGRRGLPFTAGVLRARWRAYQAKAKP